MRMQQEGVCWGITSFPHGKGLSTGKLCLKGAHPETREDRCLHHPSFLALLRCRLSSHPAAGSLPGASGSPGGCDPAWAGFCSVGMGFLGKTLSLSPFTWAGALGLPPSASSPMQGDGKGGCPMHRAVLWQGLPCLAGEQDEARIKPKKFFQSMMLPLDTSGEVQALLPAPCQNAGGKEGQGRRLTSPHPAPLICALLGLHSTYGPRRAGMHPRSCSGRLGKARAVPQQGQNSWCSWGNPSSPRAGHPRVAPSVARGEALLGVRGCAAGAEPLPVPAGMTPSVAHGQGHSLADAWGAGATSQCPTVPRGCRVTRQ